MFFRIFYIFLLISACGASDTDLIIPINDTESIVVLEHRKQFRINLEFQKHVYKFLSLVKNYSPELFVDALIVKFGKLTSEDSTALAEATFSKFYIPTIIVREAIWDDLEDWQKEYLLFHELGHALLLRDHKESLKIYKYKIKNNIIYEKTLESIMGSQLEISEPVYKNYYKQLIEELFYYRRN